MWTAANSTRVLRAGMLPSVGKHRQPANENRSAFCIEKQCEGARKPQNHASPQQKRSVLDSACNRRRNQLFCDAEQKTTGAAQKFTTKPKLLCRTRRRSR